MKIFILAVNLFLNFTSAFTNKCLKDPEDTVSSKIKAAIAETLEKVFYPSVRNTFSYLGDHENEIKAITLFRGIDARDDIRIHLKFEDKSDANFLFKLHELGNKNKKNVFLTTNTIVPSRNFKADLSFDKLSKVMKSKTVSHLTGKMDYLDQETELGSKVAFESCTQAPSRKY